MDSKENFLHEFAIMSQAGVGVFLVRSREPHRVREALMTYAFGVNDGRQENAETELTATGGKSGEVAPFEFASWDIVFGWRVFKPDEASPKGDGTLAPTEAMLQIAGLAGTDPKPEGIYMLENCHFALEDFAFVQLIKHYAHEVTSTKDFTIVLVVPEGTQVPSVIEDDIKILDFAVPSQTELEEHTQRILDARKKKCAERKKPIKFNLIIKPALVHDIAQAGRGLTLLDFEHQLDRGLLEHVMDQKEPNSRRVIRTMLDGKMEVVKRSDVLSLIEPTKMSAFGGYGRLKEWAGDVKYAETKQAVDFGIDPNKGCLLVGVQGTGKSTASKVFGSSPMLNRNTVRLDVSAVFNQYVGNSEKAMRMAIAKAKAMAPINLWIDEIDKAGFGTKGESSTGDKVLSIILYEMAESEGIFWIFTANRVSNGAIPPELVRAGRLDEIFFLGLPTWNERKDVFKIHLDMRGHDPEAVRGLDDAVDESEGYVPAEIESIVNKSLIDASKAGKKTTNGDYLIARIKARRPLSKVFKKDVDEILEWGNNNALNASNDRDTQKLNPGANDVPGTSPKSRLRNVRER